MSLLSVRSFVAGRWVDPDDSARPIENAITGDVMARAGNASLDIPEMLDFARTVGGPALRQMTFHDRARMLKALALHLGEHKRELYDLSHATGATQADNLIDVDGGIGTMFVFASKGRREMPDSHVYLDGNVEQLSRQGSFLGQHVCTPLRGAAIHINAFNFPVWGMLEKLAPTLLAGVPAIVKPATATCYVSELAVRIILASNILPNGALQFVAGKLGDALDHIDSQDIVSFTGSAETAFELRSKPGVTRNSTRFIAEQDSLNASILGPDVTPDTPEFGLFIREVHREITTKAGQKCTAIRRIMVPQSLLDPAIEALKASLSTVVPGHPKADGTNMGALVSNAQKRDVREKIGILSSETSSLHGDPDGFAVNGADARKGAFLPPILLHCGNPDRAVRVHDTEAFGPVATLMGYRDLDHAVRLANRGGGSLVASVITHDPDVAREFVMGAGAFHGRVYFNNRDSMNESTGHGSPLPHMVHGGPGRAGGGEELGGVRGVLKYMQRTAVQGSPDVLTAIGSQWIPGAKRRTTRSHPFTRGFHDLQVGDSLDTPSRTVSLADIEHFADFTGDRFYAHMDAAAARRNPFFPGRVAHGYLLLSFAAGLFVKPEEGPVLANSGLESLSFTKPVEPGDSIRVQLTVRRKTLRNEDYGEIKWHAALFNQHDEPVAEYVLLTMNSCRT